MRGELRGGMKTMKIRIFLLAALVLAVAPRALAMDVSTAKGKVVDTDGNPIPGAVITFTQASPPKTPYEIKTDKNGTYWVPNLLYRPPGAWEMTIQAEGFFTGKVSVVCRTANRTLAGEFESKIRVGTQTIKLTIPGLGEGKIDFTLSREKAPEAAAQAAAEQDPLDVARGKIQSGDYEGSVELFQKAISASPEEPERRQLFAYALLKLDRLGEAEAQATRAAQLAPDKSGSNLILAEIYKTKGDDARAWEALQKERAIAPENPRVLERIASLGAELGKIDEAIAAGETLTRLKPDDPEGWIALGSLYAEKKQLEKSEQAFRKVVELDPANAAQTFYNIGVVLANKPDISEGDNRKITEAFRKAVEQKPDYAAAHRELAFALLRSGDSEGARKELERYLELDPKAADAAEIQSLVKSLKKK